jgi:hypothetical protein
MPDVPALQIYPRLWQQSFEQHPASWPDQFRALCQLARAYRREHRAACRRLPEGERLFLQALDQCDPEDMIATLQHDFPDEANPLLRIDPADPYVDHSQYPEIYAMNGHAVKFDA